MTGERELQPRPEADPIDRGEDGDVQFLVARQDRLQLRDVPVTESLRSQGREVGEIEAGRERPSSTRHDDRTDRTRSDEVGDLIRPRTEPIEHHAAHRVALVRPLDGDVCDTIDEREADQRPRIAPPFLIHLDPQDATVGASCSRSRCSLGRGTTVTLRAHRP